MKYGLILILILFSCGTGSGKNDDTTTQETASECGGNVTFNTEVPDEGGSDDVSDDSDTDDVDVPGIINPAVTKALKQATFQGLRVVSLQKLGGVTIVGTCDATININVDSGNVTTSIDGAIPE